MHTTVLFLQQLALCLFICLFDVTLQRFAHEDNQLYIGKLYRFQYTGNVKLSLCLFKHHTMQWAGQ